MKYNHFQNQDQINSEALHAQDCMHMNDIAYILHQDLKKKKKRSTYRPPNFQAKR